MSSIVFQLLLMLLPWSARRYLLRVILGYNIHPLSSIGLSLVIASSLDMHEHSRIGHFNFLRNLDSAVLLPYSTIGNLNWIYGYPRYRTQFFLSNKGRLSSLRLGEHSSVTTRHIIDCTDQFELGDFSVIAGYRSVVLTHSVDLATSSQSCKPVLIGKYCFVGSGCLILPGAKLPDFSILSAMSLLNKSYDAQFALYGGIPAKLIKNLSPKLGFFLRKVGRIL